MKPLLSDSGAIEIGLGIFAIAVGALLVFGAGDEPGGIQSGALFAMGFGSLATG